MYNQQVNWWFSTGYFENLPLCVTKYYNPNFLITYLRTKIFNIDNWVTSPKKVQKNLGDGYLFIYLKLKLKLINKFKIKYLKKKKLANTVGSWLGTVAEIHKNLYY